MVPVAIAQWPGRGPCHGAARSLLLGGQKPCLVVTAAVEALGTGNRQRKRGRSGGERGGHPAPGPG